VKTISIIKTEAVMSIIGALGLIIWWILIPIFLPIGDSVDNFKILILDKHWIIINIIGLLSVLLLTLGFPGFFIKNYKRFNKLGFIGLVLALTGLILYTCIQYYEIFIWPAAAKINPELVQLNGELVGGNPIVVTGLFISGIFLGVGYILFGISALQIKSFPKIPLWFLIIGAPLFGNGILFPIRTVGILFFCTGTIWLANNIRKT